MASIARPSTAAGLWRIRTSTGRGPAAPAASSSSWRASASSMSSERRASARRAFSHSTMTESEGRPDRAPAAGAGPSGRILAVPRGGDGRELYFIGAAIVLPAGILGTPGAPEHGTATPRFLTDRTPGSRTDATLVRARQDSRHARSAGARARSTGSYTSFLSW